MEKDKVVETSSYKITKTATILITIWFLLSDWTKQVSFFRDNFKFKKCIFKYYQHIRSTVDVVKQRADSPD